jgi:hypothetical protein
MNLNKNNNKTYNLSKILDSSSFVNSVLTLFELNILFILRI